MENAGVTGMAVGVGLTAGSKVGVIVARFRLTWVSVAFEGVGVEGGGVSDGDTGSLWKLISPTTPQPLNNKRAVPRINPGMIFIYRLDDSCEHCER